jgi:oligopeptidase A
MSQNPLLDFSGLPRFGEIRAEHVAPAIESLLAEADAALARAVGPDVPAEYEALSAVLDVATERLSRAWGTVGHLNAVAHTPELRAAYAAMLPKVTEFYTRVGADERLYAKYKAVLADPRSAKLSPPRRKALANAVRDFRLSGAELAGPAKTHWAEVQERLADTGRRYSEHVLDATDGYAWYAGEAELDGVPADVRAAMRTAAEAEGREGFKVTLHTPSYLPVLQHGRDRALRERLYRAYVTRASEFGPPERDNASLMRELLELRAEEAHLLGYRNYAEVSLVPKMAESPADVLAFLQDLGRRARPSAERDLAELRDFARAELGLETLEAWDLAYASERLQEQRYSFSANEIREYFTEPQVLAGLFGIVETLFDVTVRPDSAPAWHDSVRFYRVERRSGPEAGRLLAQFYLDAYARPGKRPGAWMGDARDRWQRPDGRLQTPVAYLICNYAAPQGGRPALLTHDDVTTLFHEFGHGLHLMLTQIDDLGVSGISGVEWDAVELPSQFMENFCWEWEVVRRLTARVDTGAPLPRALFDRMVAAKNFQSGLQTLRQVEYATFDMRLHTEADAPARVQAIADEVHAAVAVVPTPAFNRFANTFTHVFDGGYAAGYYSYKWAEVLSADAWSAFEDAAAAGASILDVDTGRRYRQQVLEAGGSRPAMESFKAFRGREPRIDALLRHQGLV